MSQSPLSPAGKRLRTMNEDERSTINNNNNDRFDENIHRLAQYAAQRRRQLGLRTCRDSRSNHSSGAVAPRAAADNDNNVESRSVNICSDDSTDSQPDSQSLRPKPQPINEQSIEDKSSSSTGNDDNELINAINSASNSSGDNDDDDDDDDYEDFENQLDRNAREHERDNLSDVVQRYRNDVFDEDDSPELGFENSSDSESSSGYVGINDRVLVYNDVVDINSDDEDDDDDYDESLDYESDENDDSEIEHCLPDVYLKHDPTPDTQYPKPEWITVNELRQRKYGYSSSKRHSTRRSNMYWFERYANNSLWMIQRLELSKRLEEHTGCVNCLDFNTTGNLICSGSDDLTVCIWDWQLNKSIKRINTGHINNVFYSEFCLSDTNIITTSRDGTVRLINIETSFTEELLSQSGEAKMLAFITPQTLVTCGTNACVNFIDLRIREPRKLFVVRNPKNGRSCALHSINSHPLDKHNVVVAGASPYVFLYDLRRIARNPLDVEHKPTYCLDNFENTNTIVTSTAYNSTGDNLLISYNDDDLFVCRTDTCEIVHRYKGHRNKKTVKGCAWFGDNFVLSGSDDGHIYGWDLQSEHIVCFLEGDAKGVVNCLCVHPSLPILASSGFDHNVKVWEPISKTWPQTLKGIKPQICKNTMRRKRAQERRNQGFRPYGDDSDTVEY